MDTIHGNIKLNATHETNNKVNFLDFSITRKPTSLELDIYRKTTASDTTIKFLSNRPLRHKLAAYRFFINRMISLPLSEVQWHKELRSIKQNAHNNNIPIHLLTKLRRNIQKKTRPTTPPHCFHTEHKMGHLHTLLTACQKNHQSLQKYKVKVTFKSNNTTAQLTKPHTTTIPSPTPHDTSSHWNHVIVDAYAEVCIIPAVFTYLSIALQLVHIHKTHVTAELTKYMKPIIREVNKLSLKTL